MIVALLALETLALAVLALFVVALLRSHAEILCRLAALDGGRTAASGRASNDRAAGEREPEPAPAIAGVTLVGDAVKLDLGVGSPTTLLAFLSSGCAACEPLWGELEEPLPGQSAVRVVAVAKGPERESVARLRELAPATRELVLSTRAWEDYGIASSPQFVLVDGGAIAGRGSAGSWRQIGELVGTAMEDLAHPPGTAAERSGGTTAASGEGTAAGGEGTAARAERALAAAGIGSGHPSLYPAGAPEGTGGG